MTDTRVALITGGAGGIGSAIVAALAGAGWSVMAGDLPSALDGNEHVDVAAVVPIDVRDEGSVEAAVAAASELGPLVGVVNCAGILRPTNAPSFDDSDLALMWEVNLAGMARVCRAAARHESLASIVNIGSIAAGLGRLHGAFGYSATKAGVEALSRSLACELGPRGVRVNTLAPGFIDVPMSPSARSISGEAQAPADIPLGRLGLPEEIATVTAFLLSEASSYVTGSTVIVDGGVTAA